MDLLEDYLRLVESQSEQGPLPWEIIEFLVTMYAMKGTPKLGHVSGTLSQLASSKRFAMTGGIYVDWNNINAAYNFGNHTLVVNSSARGNRRRKVLDILHEIQHYNQQIRWNSKNMSYRDKFVKGKKLPPGIDPTTDEGDPLGLYEISWEDMTRFWLRRYGYERAPHEVDARRFADAKIDEAMAYIEEHFSE